MWRFVVGFLVLPVLLAAGLGVLWILNQFGVVSYQKLVLEAAGGTFGIKDLAANYDLGKKRSAILKSRTSELQQQAQQLRSQASKLTNERSNFETTRSDWEKAHPAATATQPATALGGLAQSNAVAGARDSKSQSPPADPKDQQFLATIGGMKPPKAAAVIQKLPENTVYLIFDQLDARQVSKIMENLPADFLAKLTQERLNKHGKP